MAVTVCREKCRALRTRLDGGKPAGMTGDVQKYDDVISQKYDDVIVQKYDVIKQKYFK